MKYNNDNNIDKCIINIPPDYKLKHEYVPITTKVDLAGIEVEMNNGYLEISTSFIEIPFDIVYYIIIIIILFRMEYHFHHLNLLHQLIQ